MTPFNLVLSQFLFLSILAGGILWRIFITPIESMGLKGAWASSVAGVISILFIALFVFGRWILQKKNSLPSIIQVNSQYRTGSAYVTAGNTIFLLLVAALLLFSTHFDPVVGGIAVFIGGGISLILWLFGWHLTGFFKIY